MKLPSLTTAQSVLNDVLLRYRRAANRRGEARALLTLGQVYTAVGDKTQAIEALTQAQVIYDDMGQVADEKYAWAC